MKRISVDARVNWKEKVRDEGMLWAVTEEGPFWSEAMSQPKAYQLTENEAEQLQTAGNECHAMCLEAIEWLFSKLSHVQVEWHERFGISPEMWAKIKHSFFVNEEWEFYGRFDFLQSAHGFKLLEYNADTPTTLIESSVCQWNWFAEQQELGIMHAGANQFNTIWEAMVQRWKDMRAENGLTNPSVCFVSMDEVDDVATNALVAEAAKEAGYSVKMFPISEVGFDTSTHMFLDVDQQPLHACFKLYPWEWMMSDSYSKYLPTSLTRWIEPSWKMLLSNKMLLPLLWHIFKREPRAKWLVPSFHHEEFVSVQKKDRCGKWVEKPILSREGSDVSIFTIDDIGNVSYQLQHEGNYSEHPKIYQQFVESLKFDGCTPMLGVWMVGPEAVGMGIREDDTLITRNNSRFIPHFWV